MLFKTKSGGLKELIRKKFFCDCQHLFRLYGKCPMSTLPSSGSLGFSLTVLLKSRLSAYNIEFSYTVISWEHRRTIVREIFKTNVRFKVSSYSVDVNTPLGFLSCPKRFNQSGLSHAFYRED